MTKMLSVQQFSSNHVRRCLKLNRQLSSFRAWKLFAPTARDLAPSPKKPSASTFSLILFGGCSFMCSQPGVHKLSMLRLCMSYPSKFLWPVAPDILHSTLPNNSNASLKGPLLRSIFKRKWCGTLSMTKYLFSGSSALGGEHHSDKLVQQLSI
jgi:hypothetical protein